MAEWQNRPLDPVCPVVFIDAVHVKIRFCRRSCDPVGWGSSCEQDAFAKEIEAGAAEHLAFQHFQSVDVALDGTGAVGQGQSVADGVEVAAEVAGEARKRSQAVPFDVGDPAFEAVTVAAGRHHGELPDVECEPVEFGIALTQPVQLAGFIVP
jgi:hypothetical protein